MKKLLLFVFLIGIFSCHKKTPQPATTNSNDTTGNLNFNIINKVNGQNLALNQKYVTTTGDTFYITRCEYYISNIEFMNLDNGSFYAVPNSYYLVDASNPTTANLQITGIPVGDYDQFGFSIGVDNVRNHTGAQEGALNATVNSYMYWSWSAGYKFLVLEGYYYNTSGSYSPFLFHIGSDDNFKDETFNAFNTSSWNTDVNIQSGKTSEVNVTFNIDQIMNGVDLDTMNNVMGGNDATIIANNYANMPQLIGIANP